MVVVGTRPETIKMAPVAKALIKRGTRMTLVHTGQHFDYEMGLSFIRELDLPEPEYSFRLDERRPASQIAEIMLKLEGAVTDRRPDVLLIQGDTNSMLASALIGVKTMRKVAHVEAGLRSYDWRMPEEHNRRMVDHVSDYLFAPTRLSKENLMRENVSGKIYVVGNTIIDAVDQYLPKAEQTSHILASVPFTEFALVTFHRQENVDDPQTLRNFVAALAKSSVPIVFPVHPRTKQHLRESNLWRRLSGAKNVKILPPVGYFDFLVLLRHCKFIASDSGGLQEEATSPRIRKPILVLRNSTERPEAIQAGFARMVGTNYVSIRSALREIWNCSTKLPRRSPFGDGSAADRIAHTIANSPTPSIHEKELKLEKRKPR